MPSKVYYGEETRKALANFGPGSTPVELIASYAKVKRAAVTAVQEVEARFDPELFACLLEALGEIADGKHGEQFPLPIRQGGAGTSFNMNLNEVAASRARELYGERFGREAPSLDPIEDVNRCQSTNDTFPAAVTVAAFELAVELEARVIGLQEALVAKELEFDDILIAGRTELQDALPIRLGQVFGAWAGCAERDRWRFHKVKERLRTSPLGGTAIGTCFAASPEYVYAAERELRRSTGLPLSRSQNLPDEIAHQDKLAELADAIGLCAGNLRKICGDLLLYTSSLSGELSHPELQYGSTMMPAKANPVLLEFARGHAMAAEHEAAAARAFAFEGQLQLNPYLPFLADELLDSGRSLTYALGALSRKFLPLVEAKRERIAERLVASDALLNLLGPVLGYRRVKEIAAQLRAEAEARTASGRVGMAAGGEGTAAGSEGTAAGREGTAAGSEGTAEGREGTAAGRVGTIAGRVGTIAGREGTIAGSEGTIAGSEGTAARFEEDATLVEKTAPAGPAPATRATSALLEDYIDRVARKSGLSRDEIARRFDPHRATTLGYRATALGRRATAMGGGNA